MRNLVLAFFRICVDHIRLVTHMRTAHNPQLKNGFNQHTPHCSIQRQFKDLVFVCIHFTHCVLVYVHMSIWIWFIFSSMFDCTRLVSSRDVELFAHIILNGNGNGIYKVSEISVFADDGLLYPMKKQQLQPTNSI